MIQLVNQDIYTTISDVLVAPVGLDGILDTSVAGLPVIFGFEVNSYLQEAVKLGMLHVGSSLLTDELLGTVRRIAFLPVLKDEESVIRGLTYVMSGLADIRRRVEYGVESISIPLMKVYNQSSMAVTSAISSVFEGMPQDKIVMIHV